MVKGRFDPPVGRSSNDRSLRVPAEDRSRRSVFSNWSMGSSSGCRGLPVFSALALGSFLRREAEVTTKVLSSSRYREAARRKATAPPRAALCGRANRQAAIQLEISPRRDGHRFDQVVRANRRDFLRHRIPRHFHASRHLALLAPLAGRARSRAQPACLIVPARCEASLRGKGDRPPSPYPRFGFRAGFRARTNDDPEDNTPSSIESSSIGASLRAASPRSGRAGPG
jgi:hypothetical protein